MRIVHVTSGLSRLGDGVREVVMHLSRTQATQGHEVTVFGLETPEWKDRKAHWRGAEVKVLSVLGPRRFGFAPDMTTSIEVFDPEIVHLHGLWMHPGRSVLQWQANTGRPFVISAHGMLSKAALAYGTLKKRVVSYWFQNKIFDRAAAVLVTSEQEAEDARSFGISGQIHIVPNGIELAQIPIRDRSSHRTILYLGRIHHIKGLDELIHAWSRLQLEFPDWCVRIVGPSEDGELNRLRKIVDVLGVERIRFSEPVYGGEKVRLLASADIFVLPSKSENFALTVAESLMLGVPVIASEGSPWSGLVRERCGLWVPYGAASFSDALREMMSATAFERGEMGARGRAWMQRDFSWESVCEKLLNHYAAEVSRR